MPIYNIDLPDGQTLRLEAPENMAQEVVFKGVEDWWQHKTNPTFLSTAQAIADKGVAGGAWDVASATTKGAVGLGGSIPQFMEHSGRSGYETSMRKWLGGSIGQEKDINEVQKTVQGRMEGSFTNSIAQATYPESSELAKYGLHKFGQAMETVLDWAGEGANYVENWRRQINSMLPQALQQLQQQMVSPLPDDVGQALTATQPLTPEESAETKQATKVGLSGIMAGQIATSAVKAPIRFGKRLNQMRRLRKAEDSAGPQPGAGETTDFRSIAEEAMGRTSPEQRVLEPFGGDMLPPETMGTGTIMPEVGKLRKGKPQKPVAGATADLTSREPAIQGETPPGPDPFAQGVTAQPQIRLPANGAKEPPVVSLPDPGKTTKNIIDVDIAGDTTRAGHVTKIWEKVQASDLPGALREIAQNSSNEIYKAFANLYNMLAEEYRPYLAVVDAKTMRVLSGSAKSPQGMFDPKSNYIMILGEGRTLPIDHVLMHEVTHAMVYNLQRAVESGARYLGGKLIPESAMRAAEQIRTLWEEAKAEWGKTSDKVTEKRPFALADHYEFIAEAIGRPEFQEWLRRVKRPDLNETYMQAFRRSVNDMLATLGIKQSESFLDVVLASSKDLIEEAKDPAMRAPAYEGADVAMVEGPAATLGFAKEQGVTDGQAMAMADLDAPLSRRLHETIELGKDMAVEKGTQGFVELPNDMGKMFQKWMANPEQLMKMLGDRLPVVKAAVDRILYTKRKWQYVAETIMDGGLRMIEDSAQANPSSFMSYVRRSGKGFRSIVERMTPENQLSFFKVARDWENSKELKAAGLQWPTRDMLKAKGVGEAVIDAYEQYSKYMDVGYDLINYGRKLQGKGEIKRIPGYFPHSYRGNWSIRIVADGARGPVTIGFSKANGGKKNLVKTANDIIADVENRYAGEIAEDGLSNVRAEIYRTDKPNTSGDIMSSFQQVLDVYGNSTSKIGTLVHDMLAKRMDAMEQAFLGHAQKRFNIPGWIGSFADAKVKDMAEVLERYMEDTVKFAEASDIQYNVWNQLTPKEWMLMRDHLPNAHEYLFKFKELALEKPNWTQIDTFFLDAFSFLTRDKLPYKAPIYGLHTLRKIFSAMDLAWSLSYHSGNLIQPEMFGAIALAREAARIGKGDATMAWATAWNDMIRPNAEMREALIWASKHKVTSPKLMQELGFSFKESIENKGRKMSPMGFLQDVVTGRRASEYNEALGRTRSFIMGYNYYKSTGMTKAQALQAAAKFTDDVMVDYSALGQPLWISSNPGGQIASRLVAPYAAFRHSYWGHTALALKALKANPGLAPKILPILGLQLATLFAAGFRGMAFMAEVQMFVNTVNTFWEDIMHEEGPLPNPEAMMVNGNASNFMLFGGMSSIGDYPAQAMGMKGADVSTTLAAPSVGEFLTPRQLQGAADIGFMFKGFLELVLSGQVPDASTLRLAQTLLPGWSRGISELALHPDYSFSDPTNFPETSRDPRGRSKGLVEREKGDWVTRTIFGKRTMDEQRKMLTGRQIVRDNNRIAERKADLVELGADMMDKGEPIPNKLIDEAVDAGYKYTEYMDRVRDQLKDRRSSRIRRYYNSQTASPTRRRIRDTVDEALPDTNYFGLMY